MLSLLVKYKFAKKDNVVKEIIIIDDFSTDGSKDIVKKYESNHSFIKAYYKNENKGKGDSQKIAN